MNRGSRWAVGAALGAIAALTLAGCADEEEPDPSTGTPTETPLESELSESALLSHAVQTAGDFVALTDQAFSELEVPEGLYDVTTDEIASNIAADVGDYVDLGYHLEGTSQLTNPTQISIQVTSSNSGLVSLIACLDTTGSQVVDALGAPVPGDGTAQRPVTFDIRWQNETGTVIGTAFPNEAASDPCVR